MIDRRMFLASAAVRPAGRRLRAAFLGAAHSHAYDKLRLVMHWPDYELAGVWEESAQARAALEKLGPLPWRPKEAILEDPGVEVVFVESDVPQIPLLAIEALKAGKHCHIEKPIADTRERLRRIVSLAESKGLVIQAGYMWRHNPAVERALEAARHGWLGDVWLIQARMNTWIGAERRPEWNRYAGGQMFEQGAHLVDIVVRLLGRPRRVTPFLRHDGPFADTLKDNTAAVLEYARTMAVITASVLQPNAGAHRALEIFGTNGSAVVRPIEPPSLEVDLARPAGPHRAGRQKVDLPPYERYAGDIAALARAVRGERPLEVTPALELAVHETLLEASGMAGGRG
ncbi:MAG: Gfo/Idh/MocA family protein [Bryobacteraceae bacterium]